ncbi:ABC transporter permease [Streptomyces sp. NPDC046977]|uniref:ABC transporter permease n=1 Tax=Streptomyces sp. NPDC046977 TaxID=3154703 RepID=UPI0033C6C4B2
MNAEREPARSRFLPAFVLIPILAAMAGLFAGSYSFAMAHPTPHRVPIGVVDEAPAVDPFLTRLDAGLSTQLEEHRFATRDAAVAAVERQHIFAVLQAGPGGRGVTLELVPAAGASVARVLAAAAPGAAAQAGVPLTVTSLKPLQPGDPQGLAIFYITLAAIIIGFVGSGQLSLHAPALRPLERIAAIVAFSVLGGFAICAVVDWGLHVLRLPFWESWGILTLTMVTSALVFTMFHILCGRWAILPTWALMVLLGNPSSGGAVSWPLLPQPLGAIGRWLPPGASVNAQHNAIYFYGHQYAFPFLVLIGWALLAVVVFWTWRYRSRPRTSS